VKEVAGRVGLIYERVFMLIDRPPPGVFYSEQLKLRHMASEEAAC